MRDLLKLTDETIKHRVRRYKGQPRTVFISGRTVPDTQASVHMVHPEMQTRAAEEWAIFYTRHAANPTHNRYETQLPRRRIQNQLLTQL